MWKCICDCGNTVDVSTTSLNAGHKKSCGCLNTESRKKNVLKMGEANKKDVMKRFFSFVKKTKGCWNWIGDIGVGGYGRIWYNGKTVKAHRLSYEKFIGPIPEGILICHTCDNPKCVNPKHLFLGTHQDNNSDKTNKDRQAKGNTSGMSKLTEAQVMEIKKLLHSGMQVFEITKMYPVTWGAISCIQKGKTWKHVKYTPPKKKLVLIK